MAGVISVPPARRRRRHLQLALGGLQALAQLARATLRFDLDFQMLRCFCRPLGLNGFDLCLTLLRLLQCLLLLAKPAELLGLGEQFSVLERGHRLVCSSALLEGLNVLLLQGYVMDLLGYSSSLRQRLFQRTLVPSLELLSLPVPRRGLLHLFASQLQQLHPHDRARLLDLKLLAAKLLADLSHAVVVGSRAPLR